MKKMLQFSFLAVLVAVLGLGVVAITEPVTAQLKPAPGPITDCPSLTCPTDLTGWSYSGSCTTYYAHDCVEQCTVYQSSSGQKCKKTTNCAWW